MDPFETGNGFESDYRLADLEGVTDLGEGTGTTSHCHQGVCFVGDDDVEGLPRTVDEAIHQIMSDMSLKDRTTMANLDEENLEILQFTLRTSVSILRISWMNGL